MTTPNAQTRRVAAAEVDMNLTERNELLAEAASVIQLAAWKRAGQLRSECHLLEYPVSALHIAATKRKPDGAIVVELQRDALGHRFAYHVEIVTGDSLPLDADHLRKETTHAVDYLHGVLEKSISRQLLL